MESKKEFSKKTILSTCIGNLFEHYDAALFSFLSCFLAPIIFPKKEPLSALIYMYAMIPLGMLARPLGALFFGYIGDTFGRKSALFHALTGMGFVSLVIAFLPTHSSTGFLPPLLFCIARILQNFFAAGETSGGAIYLLEGTDKKNHDFLSGIYSASTVAGIIIASIATSAIAYYDCILSGWRILYLVGAFTAFFGLVIRKKSNSNLHEKNDAFKFSIRSHFENLWKERKTIAIIALFSGFSYVNYTMSLVLPNGLVPMISNHSHSCMLGLSSFLLLLDLLLLPFFGYISAKISREKVMMWSSLSILIIIVPSMIFLQSSSFLIILIIRSLFVILGVAFAAPLHAYLQNCTSASHRYTLISLGYALGSQIIGGPSAAVSLWIFKKTGMLSSVCWYWAAIALTSCLILWRLHFHQKKALVI